MDETEFNEVVSKLETARNFLVGVSFDPRLPNEIKKAIKLHADEIDSFLLPILAKYY